MVRPRHYRGSQRLDLPNRFRNLLVRPVTSFLAQLAQAHEQLRQATQVQIAAAQEARKLREQAHAAKDAELLGAAASTATEGDLAMTERHYPQAADLFKQAAELGGNGPDSDGAEGAHRHRGRSDDAEFLVRHVDGAPGRLHRRLSDELVAGGQPSQARHDDDTQVIYESLVLLCQKPS
jgi:hypothetical protein